MGKRESLADARLIKARRFGELWEDITSEHKAVVELTGRFNGEEVIESILGRRSTEELIIKQKGVI